MPEFLTFIVAAPLAAMGELAVGERRGGWTRPGRSAVLGLVAACLGVDRADETAHATLDGSFGLALWVEQCGPLLADYHTAQVPPSRRGRRFATRAEELAAPELETVLSRRDYRSDVLVTLALWAKAQAPWSLRDIERALHSPHFTPYFGRKSCPLMLPMAPRLGDHADPVAALKARVRSAGEIEGGFQVPGRSPTVTLDVADAEAFGLRWRRIEQRRDRPVSRRRWQFALRREAVFEVE
jgi:CRISPR system Cascade subunit CasD